MINFEKWNIQHQNQAEKDVKKLGAVYEEVLRMTAFYTSKILFDDILFEFNKIPYLKKQIDSLLKRYARNVEDIIEDSVVKHWSLSNNKLNTFENEFFKSVKVAKKPINKRNLEGLKAFRNRPNRMLSTRVWTQSKQLREEMEMALDLALKEGTPANALASKLKKYLNEPEQLFRKYRDKNGQLQLSKKAQAYNPGRGVYRSSYKNAQRLARTEINMAYRLADIERFQSLDFVIGYEIKRSKHPYPCDICDMMAGVYPKTFIWSGNHPNCRCYLVPILQKREDFLNDLNSDSNEVPEQITKVNPKLTKWVNDNQERIIRAEKRGTLPYFLKDNKGVWKDIVHNPVREKLSKALKPFTANTYVAFEPFSPVIVKELQKLDHYRKRQKLLREIIDDSRAKLLFENKAQQAKTVLFDGHKGVKSKYWKQTQQMAKDLNKYKSDVAFLPEYENISSADAIVKFKERYVIADFKYSNTTNHNTIAEELLKGYKQANCTVLKMDKGGADTFTEIVKQIKRKNGSVKDLILINKYGKVLELDYKQLKNGNYKKKIRGFF